MVPRLLRRISQALLLLWLSSLSYILLFGHAIYPSSPLLLLSLREETPSRLWPSSSHDSEHNDDGREWSRPPSEKLILATVSFVLATSARTAILGPLTRFSSFASSSSSSSRTASSFSSLAERVESALDGMERFAHLAWEDAARRSEVLREEESSPPSSSFIPARRRRRDPPEVDLNALVPCDRDAAREYLKRARTTTTSSSSNDDRNDHGGSGDGDGGDVCRLRDVITRRILEEHVRAVYPQEEGFEQFDLASHPIVLRNARPPESFENDDFDDDDESGERRRRRRPLRLTPESILRDPRLSELLLPNHFSDATRTGYDALVPDEDSTITLSDFVRGILEGRTPRAKIGTQVVVERMPELRSEIVPPSDLAREIFGWTTWPDDARERARERFGSIIGGGGVVGRLLDKLPSASCFPVFVAGNRPSSSSGGDDHPRTDLHAEPIGNVASQLHGARRWTLVPTRWSGLLRPSASKHGRGYFYANLDPYTELPGRLDGIPDVYECVTRRGDVLWIPPWMWHRVDYDGVCGDEEECQSTADPYENLSIGASIFHFYPLLYVTNFPLFSFLIIPNLIQEVLGLNVE